MSDVEYEKYGVPDGTNFEPGAHQRHGYDFNRFVEEFRAWCLSEEMLRMINEFQTPLAK